MIQTDNLANLINKQLPLELVQFMHLAGEVAARQKQRLFLVGGVVRDLLLKRENLDLDLVAEKDAVSLAEEMARLKGGKVIAHSRFNTTKVRWDKWSVDIATARAESYEARGALPSVQCQCSIQDDLIRRDFTINAMAVHLDPQHYGELIDLYHSRKDLKHEYIRILHDNSFKDDATRIWRAVRYEQRLNFSIERHTLEILRRDIGYLDTISGDRIRHELELCLEEDKPEKPLLRANQLKVLCRINSNLEADEWLARKISRARSILQPYYPPKELMLAFLFYRLSHDDLEQIINYLKFPHTVSQDLVDTLELKNELQSLTKPELAPSQIYRCLHSYSQTAILANLMVTDNQLVRQRIDLYVNKLRNVQPALTGNDLLEMGIGPGRQIKEVLEHLRDARLDGRASTREEEQEIVSNRSF